VQHHESQPPVALQRILQVERNDRLLLPLLQPKVPENPAVMLIDLAVPLAPAVELAGRDVEPPDEPPGADSDQLRTKSTIWSRVSCGTPVRVPQLFFLGQRVP